MKGWRSKGRQAVIHIDDSICAAFSVGEVVEHSAAIQENLKDAEFVINVDKSRFIPHQVSEWLGFTINLVSGCFHLPDEKIEKLKE